MSNQPTIGKRLLVTLAGAVGGGLFVVIIMLLFFKVVVPCLFRGDIENDPASGFIYGIAVTLGEPALNLDQQFGYPPSTLSPYLVNGVIAGIVSGSVTAFWVFMVKPALKSFDEDQTTNLK